MKPLHVITHNTMMVMYVPQATAPASANEVWHVEEQLLREALVPHPKLMAAIFPPPPKKGTPAETQDISLYQLLQVSMGILYRDFSEDLHTNCWSF